MTYECKVYDKNGKLKKVLKESQLTNSKEQKNDYNCLIKVFRYKNEKHAKAEKYSGWNIYRLTK